MVALPLPFKVSACVSIWGVRGATPRVDSLFDSCDWCEVPYLLKHCTALVSGEQQRDARLGDGESQNIVNVRGKTWEAAASNLILEARGIGLDWVSLGLLA